MTDSAFKKGILKLEAAFRQQPLNEKTIEIYYSKLKEADDRTWEVAVEEIIRDEDFFPSIACLNKYCGLSPSYDAAGRELKYV